MTEVINTVSEFKAQATESILPNQVVDYLKITPSAKEQIKKLIAKQAADTKENPLGIRLALKPKGCSGMKYGIEFAQKEINISKYDDLVIYEDIKVFIEPKISIWIIGTLMDYVDDGINAGFIFTNPNEKGKCGCGESFYV
jgi:iron-sulfur cluster assembly protein